MTDLNETIGLKSGPVGVGPVRPHAFAAKMLRHCRKYFSLNQQWRVVEIHHLLGYLCSDVLCSINQHVVPSTYRNASRVDFHKSKADLTAVLGCPGGKACYESGRRSGRFDRTTHHNHRP